MNAPVTLLSKAEALHDLAWWQAEAKRNGSDWQTLGQVVAPLLLRLRILPCPVCERGPCRTPSFCQQCRQADRQRKVRRYGR